MAGSNEMKGNRIFFSIGTRVRSVWDFLESLLEYSRNSDCEKRKLLLKLVVEDSENPWYPYAFSLF